MFPLFPTRLMQNVAHKRDVPLKGLQDLSVRFCDVTGQTEHCGL
jgi:hypothetical protein